MEKLRYGRVMLKLSGEALAGEQGFGIEPQTIQSICRELAEAASMGVQLSMVIGGGNVAVDVALTARRLGAKDVTMVCLEKRDEMPAWDYEIEEALEEGVKIVNSLGPLRFIGDKGKVSEVEFKECTTVFDENGRFSPQYDDCKLTMFETDIFELGFFKL